MLLPIKLIIKRLHHNLRSMDEWIYFIANSLLHALETRRTTNNITECAITHEPPPPPAQSMDGGYQVVCASYSLVKIGRRAHNPCKPLMADIIAS